MFYFIFIYYLSFKLKDGWINEGGQDYKEHRQQTAKEEVIRSTQKVDF